MSVHYRLANAVAVLTLDSPSNRNALSAQLIAELSAHLHSAATDPQVRAVLLTHTGATFCAGADLGEAAAEQGPEAGTRRVIALLRLLVEHPKPVIGRVNGHVRAGGLGLLGACDMVFAGKESTFAFTETRIGVAPAMITLTLLPVLDARAASRYLLTGTSFDATIAADIGLITAAQDDTDDLDAAVESELQALRRCAPTALDATKKLLTATTRARMDSDAQMVAELSASLFASDDAREGIAAFFAKRPPAWVL